jgi:putative transcriptional regulator
MTCDNFIDKYLLGLNMFMIKRNYLGHLLVSNPSNPRDELGDRSVILMATYGEGIAIGLQINRVNDDLDLASVSGNLGVNFDSSYPIFYGGNTNTAKIHMIHSLDWSSAGTVKVTNDIGITNDISVLVAIAQGQGPAHFRACAGYWWWENTILNQMLDPKLYAECPNPYRWQVVPSSLETVFSIPPDEQWETALEQSTKFLVDCYF